MDEATRLRGMAIDEAVGLGGTAMCGAVGLDWSMAIVLDIVL